MRFVANTVRRVAGSWFPSRTTDEVGFLCACDEELRSACSDLGYFGTHAGRQYCVLHLPDTNKNEQFWKAVTRKLDQQDLDFSGAWFPSAASFASVTFGAFLMLRRAHFRAEADFSGASLLLGGNFSEAVFGGEAKFVGTTFGAEDVEEKPANFEKARFRRKADFSGATFNAQTEFWRARFIGEADFSNTEHRAYCWFSHSRFRAYANFSGSTFAKATYFNGVNFRAQATISAPGAVTTFEGFANFAAARFRGPAIFIDADFAARAVFTERTSFKADGNFNGASFQEAEFDEAVFETVGAFRDASFGRVADFSAACFNQANFELATFKGEDAIFARTTFGPAASFMNAEFTTNVTFEGAVFGGEVYPRAVCIQRHLRTHQVQRKRLFRSSGLQRRCHRVVSRRP